MKAIPVLVLIALATELAARLTADREAVWSGTLAGLSIAAVGLYFAIKMARRHRAAPAKPAGFGDIWGFWSIGFAARMVLALVCAWVLFERLGDRAWPALFSLLGVYALTLATETFWLYRVFSEQPVTNGAAGGR